MPPPQPNSVGQYEFWSEPNERDDGGHLLYCPNKDHCRQAARCNAATSRATMDATGVVDCVHCYHCGIRIITPLSHCRMHEEPHLCPERIPIIWTLTATTTIHDMRVLAWADGYREPLPDTIIDAMRSLWPQAQRSYYIIPRDERPPFPEWFAKRLWAMRANWMDVDAD